MNRAERKRARERVARLLDEKDPPNHTGGDVCVECGGGECGLHPKGCVYGGFSAYTGYWLVADGCELRHD